MDIKPGELGWKLVRHVPPGLSWHPATDDLSGTDEYGTPDGPLSNQAWSIKFDQDDFELFLFALGNCIRTFNLLGFSIGTIKVFNEVSLPLSVDQIFASVTSFYILGF